MTEKEIKDLDKESLGDFLLSYRNFCSLAKDDFETAK